MRLKMILIFFFLLFGSSSFAQESVQETFRRGNEAYQSGNFQKAIESYESIRRKNIVSPELFFNLGNSYFKAGKRGRALANYALALRLDPRNRDARKNYAFVLSQAPSIRADSFFSKFADSIEKAVSWISLKEALGSAALLHLVFFSFLILRTRKQRRLFGGTSLFFSLFYFAFLGIVLLKFYSEVLFPSAFTVQEKSFVSVEPRPHSLQLFELQDGVRVQVRTIENNYIKIELEDGRKGWILSPALQIVTL